MDSGGGATGDDVVPDDLPQGSVGVLTRLGVMMDRCVRLLDTP